MLPPSGVRRDASPLGVRKDTSPLGVRRDTSPLGVPADLQSADKKGSTYLMRICNPPQARLYILERVSPNGPSSGLQIRNSYQYSGGLQIRRNRENRERITKYYPYPMKSGIF